MCVLSLSAAAGPLFAVGGRDKPTGSQHIAIVDLGGKLKNDYRLKGSSNSATRYAVFLGKELFPIHQPETTTTMMMMETTSVYYWWAVCYCYIVRFICSGRRVN